MLKANGDVPLRALVETQVRHMSRGSTVVLITAGIQTEIAVLADFLLRRGLRPVVILLKADTFGGLPGTEKLAAQLAAYGVPMRCLRCNDNLAEALSLDWAPAVES